MDPPRGVQGAGAAERSVSARWLLMSFAAVIACFGASTAYSQHRSAAISTAALDIAQDAAPSIEALAVLRSELSDLGLLAEDYVDELAARQAADPARVGASLSQIDQRLIRYFSLPAHPGERALWLQLRQQREALDRAVQHLGAVASARDPAAEARTRRREVRAAIAGMADTLLHLTDQNAREAHDLALRIDGLRHRSLRVAVALDILSAVLAMLAAALTAVELWRYKQAVTLGADLLARRAEELEQFASRVAHDIRGPLNAVGLALALIQLRAEGPSTQEAVARAKASVERAQWITNDLFSFACAGAAPEPGAQADVGSILDGLASELGPLAKESGVELQIEPFPACAVACGAGILSCLLSNLLRNSIKYMGRSDRRQVRVRVLPSELHVRIEVADTGPGIAPDVLPKVFEPYVRGAHRSLPGLGLGLATVKRICETHRGRVGVESTIGVGSCFWFELPRAGGRPG